MQVNKLMIFLKKSKTLMVTFGGCYATNSLLKSENRGKELSIFLAFPVQIVFQTTDGSQINSSWEKVLHEGFPANKY